MGAIFFKKNIKNPIDIDANHSYYDYIEAVKNCKFWR